MQVYVAVSFHGEDPDERVFYIHSESNDIERSECPLRGASVTIKYSSRFANCNESEQAEGNVLQSNSKNGRWS